MADATYGVVHFLLSGAKDIDGSPLSLGKVYVYVAGTTRLCLPGSGGAWPVIQYRDNAGHLRDADMPLVLDEAGVAVVYGLGVYKFVICNSQGAVIQTIDGVRCGYDSNLGTAADVVPMFLNGIPDAQGHLLREGIVEMYEAGTANPKNLDSVGTPVDIAATSPVSVQIGHGNYKFIIKDIQGNVIRTIDYLHLGAPVFAHM